MRRTLEMARDVQRATIASEAAFDEALRSYSVLASTVLGHRDEAGIGFAHPSVINVVEGLGALVARRRAFIEMHAAFRQTAVDDLHLPVVGIGASQPCPDEFFTSGEDRSGLTGGTVIPFAA